MRNHKNLIIIALIAFIIPKAFAQDMSTQGKEFWVSYMGNGYKDNHFPSYVDTQLLISAKRSCSGTITNPLTGWSNSFTVEANNITLVDIPNAQAYNETLSYEVASSKGLQIVTTDTVTVYCTNIAANSFDASYVLPIQALANDYMVQTYDQSWAGTSSYAQYLTSAFLIVAVEDNTTVDITPTVTTLGGKPAGQTFSVTLQAGQTFQVRSNNNTTTTRDLTGSRITAHDCKPIAVFNGNTLTTVPGNITDGFDHIFEQAMPLRSWGKRFVVTQSYSRNRDYVKIVSAVDNNEVRKNGQVVATLSAGQAHGFYLTSSEKSCYLEATGPSAVYLYNTTSTDGKGNGDPSMLWISPIEQRLNDITLATFSGDANHNSSIDYHHINIIVATADTDKVYFDGELLSSSDFSPVNGNPDYSYTRKSISYDSHRLTCVNGFNAHVYGFGSNRGYAYMVGSNAADLTTSIFVNEEVVIPYDTVGECGLDTYDFVAEINLGDYNLVWDFGDGTTSTDNPATHTYHSHDIFEASLTVNTAELPCGGGAQGNSYTFYVDLSGIEDAETEYSSGLCDSIVWNGKTYYLPDIYTDTIPNEDGCYSLVHLNLDLDYTPHPTEIYPTDPANTAPHWVITATEFHIVDYEYTLSDLNPQCHWDSIQWEFEDPAPQWVLEPSANTTPKGEKCKFYVLARVEDTVWLRARVFNKCKPEGVDARYWFVCSFYDVDENGPSTGSGTAWTFDFDVTPNPNHGELEIVTHQVEGEANVKIYDMTGQLVDEFGITATQNSRHPYNMSDLPDGIYLMVFDHKGKTITKKFVLTQ